MPSEEAPRPAKEKADDGAPVAAGPVKMGGPCSKGGRAGESRKMARGGSGGETGRKSNRLASEGEKDSGFSDVSSEYLSAVEQTDSEDQPADTLRQAPRWPKRALPPKAGAPLAAGDAFAGFTPIYIVKNVILKQPLGAPPATEFLAWGSQHPLSGAQGPPARVLFIQSPVASLKPLLPSQKPPSKETYLPILSAYPKIAPHPGPDPQAKGAADSDGPLPAGGTKKSKRSCLEEAWVSSSEPPTPKDMESGGQQQQQQGGEPAALARPHSRLLGAEALSQSTVTSSSSSSSHGRRCLEQAEGRLLSKATKRLSGHGPGKQRRFQNTVEILHRSGLLGIALRTKELLRQNSSTQRELSELREQARLFCQAVQSNDAQAWALLQQALDHRSSAHWAARGARGSSAGAGLEDPAGSSPPCPPVSLSLTPDPSGAAALP